jgi:hypothetical protein
MKARSLLPKPTHWLAKDKDPKRSTLVIELTHLVLLSTARPTADHLLAAEVAVVESRSTS